MKTGLVLEGGGMRGAYTAGVLAGLLDAGIHVDYVVGISSGAIYAAMYVLKKRQALETAAIDVAAMSRNVGWQAFLHEGTPVGYNFLFYQGLPGYTDFDPRQLYQADATLEIGVYDIVGCETIWKNQDDLAKQPLYLKAAATLPLAGRRVTIDGRTYMDGGITTMIPIGRALEQGCDRFLVVTTKDPAYVRKPNSKPLQTMLDLVYGHKNKLASDFRKRHLVYYKEREMVDRLVQEELAINLYPDHDTGVKRFGGTKKQFSELFSMGLSDVKTNLEQIRQLFEPSKR